MKSRTKQHPRSLFCNRCGTARLSLLVWHDKNGKVAGIVCARCWNQLDDARSDEDRGRVRQRAALIEVRAPSNPEGA